MGVFVGELPCRMLYAVFLLGSVGLMLLLACLLFRTLQAERGAYPKQLIAAVYLLGFVSHDSLFDCKLLFRYKPEDPTKFRKRRV